jgi:hypothetical protein
MNRTFAASVRGLFSVLLLALLAGLVADIGSAAEQQKAILSSKQLKALVATAKTPADHLKLARHYAAMADKHEAEANEHIALAAEYRKAPRASESKRPMSPDTAAHCEYYAEHCRKAAQEMRTMAKMHEEMAKTSQ